MEGKVFVVDKRKKPLMPTHPARARQLLREGRAVVHKQAPFAIRMKDRLLEDSEVQPVRCKVDPGSKQTGIALLRESEEKGEAEVLHLAVIHHRTNIKKNMDQRRGHRRRRRSKNLRYRKPRFDNRRRREGWLPPSLQSRVDNITGWVNRYSRLLPVSAISVETAQFDTQKMQNPEVSGIEYQRGELFGYEVWQYLLEKWNYRCAYCSKKDVPLEKDHIVPRSRGGSNRVSNLAASCRPCNEKKSNRTAEEFGHPRVQEKSRKPLRNAAGVNNTKNALLRKLGATGLPVETGTGARTKFNREARGLEKFHANDAICVGQSTPEIITGEYSPVLVITAKGRGSRQRTRLNRFGFPRAYLMEEKRVFGFATGDLVNARVERGKYAGTYRGCEVRVRKSGYFDIYKAGSKQAQGVSYRHFSLVQRSDGYAYAYN